MAFRTFRNPMSTFAIPAKTFLLGEYAVLKKAPAMILTTTPGFTITVCMDDTGKKPHPQSPAGRYLAKHNIDASFHIHTPYPHLEGGLGASSAQFIAAWRSQQSQKTNSDYQTIFDEFQACTQNNQSFPPSGADVLAQLSGGIAVIHPRPGVLCQSSTWLFANLALCLWHTGTKLPTHDHLNDLEVIPEDLVTAATQGVHAWLTKDPNAWILGMQNFADALAAHGLVARHTQEYLSELRKDTRVIAAKGCGAMGADVILALCEKSAYNDVLLIGQKLGLIPLEHSIAPPLQHL